MVGARPRDYSAHKLVGWLLLLLTGMIESIMFEAPPVMTFIVILAMPIVCFLYLPRPTETPGEVLKFFSLKKKPVRRVLVVLDTGSVLAREGDLRQGVAARVMNVTGQKMLLYVLRDGRPTSTANVEIKEGNFVRDERVRVQSVQRSS